MPQVSVPGSRPPPTVRSAFAKGVAAERPAIAAALAEPWSNGQTEGRITKFKPVKRQIYGRAGPDLLKVRLLPAV